MYIHYWGNGETSWPGTAMENFYTDNSGKKYYRATIPDNLTGIQLTNGSQYTKMTGDITEHIADGAWWEVNSTTSAGKYGVDYKGLIPHGNCGTSGHESDVTWVLAGTSPNYTLVISGSGAMADYGSNNQPWNSYLASIERVVINSGVTHIGKNSFYRCSSLTSATLPDGLTTIGNYAFSLCSNLASINIPNGLTSIGSNAFEQSKISSINIPSSVANIGYQALLHCTSLSNITVDSGNDNYSSEDGALFDKDKTKIIQYPIAKSGDTYTLPATVTYIYDHAFRGCTNLTSFNVPDGVTKIGSYAFSECTNLASVAISNSVTTINDNAFSWCSNLTSVSLPNNLQKIAMQTFWECYKLESITIPANVTSIEQYAFWNCSELETITLNSNPSISTLAFYEIKSGATITMNLAVKKAAEGEYWTTFYNENYNFQVPASGTQIFKAELDGTELTLTGLETDKIITKDKAVILKSDASPIVLTLTTTNSSNDFSVEEGKTGLSGVSSASGLTATGSQFVLNKGSNGVGFYKMTSDKVIGVGKAYLTYSGSLAREFFGFNEATALTLVKSEKRIVNSEVYDLQGRRVENPTKGLYIVNGKIVVIK